jgi:hypothetical protein
MEYMMLSADTYEEEDELEETISAIGVVIRKLCRTKKPPTTKRVDQITSLANVYARLLNSKGEREYDPFVDGTPGYHDSLYITQEEHADEH